jgi:hypothetical protein
MTESDQTSTTDEKSKSELREKFRNIAIEAGMENPSVQRDRYAKFMAEKEYTDRGFSKHYAKEMAERFKNGREWHKLDLRNKALLLKVMTEPADGTARELTPQDLINGYLEATDGMYVYVIIQHPQDSNSEPVETFFDPDKAQNRKQELEENSYSRSKTFEVQEMEVKE